MISLAINFTLSGSDVSNRTFFRATIFPVDLSRALYTLLYVPWPTCKVKAADVETFDMGLNIRHHYINYGSLHLMKKHSDHTIAPHFSFRRNNSNSKRETYSICNYPIHRKIRHDIGSRKSHIWFEKGIPTSFMQSKRQHNEIWKTT